MWFVDYIKLLFISLCLVTRINDISLQPEHTMICHPVVLHSFMQHLVSVIRVLWNRCAPLKPNYTSSASACCLIICLRTLETSVSFWNASISSNIWFRIIFLLSKHHQRKILKLIWIVILSNRFNAWKCQRYILLFVCADAFIPIDVFYNETIDYFDLQRAGGLKSHLFSEHKGEYAWIYILSVYLKNCLVSKFIRNHCSRPLQIKFIKLQTH